jgi:hypothetical protein
VAIDKTKFAGTLPYAAELFGVYQPLLGWKSKRTLRRLQKERYRLIEAAIDDLRKAAPSRGSIRRLPRPIGPDDLLPEDLPHWLSTKGASQVRAVAVKFVEDHGHLPTGADWQAIIKGVDFTKIIGEAATSKRVRAIGGPASGDAYVRSAAATSVPAQPTMMQEAMVAGTLTHLAKTAPEALGEILALRPYASALLDSAIDPLAHFDPATQQMVLSPIGLVDLFREYFFEFDTFLGPPVGHVWVSPGGTLELFEIHTRKTFQERQLEAVTETVERRETEVTEEDELSTAIGEENAQNIGLGVSASAGVDFGVVEGNASASLDLQFNTQSSQETAHRHTRTQSEKLSSEIRRNFKTTFRTSIETIDTSSRRYVLQNTTDQLVNYELRRKMRQVGIQVQHVGMQLCWQTFVDEPGLPIGVGMLVHAAVPEDLFTAQPPDAPPVLEAKQTHHVVDFAFEPLDENAQDDGEDEEYDHGHDVEEDSDEGFIRWKKSVSVSPPAAGYTLQGDPVIASWFGPSPDEDQPLKVAAECKRTADDTFEIRLNYVDFNDQPSIVFQVDASWAPPPTSAAAQQDYEQKLKDFNNQKQKEAHAAYVKAIRERIEMAGKVRPRPSADLRDEERRAIYRQLIRQLTGIKIGDDPHLTAELIRAIFDVDKMLYYVAADWWMPRQTGTGLKFGDTKQLTVEDRIAWSPAKLYGRPNYWITKESEPAPMGSSLGWLIQLDGDMHRNAFLNSPWVKAVLPIRHGKEVAAINWLKLAHVEGTENLDAKYGGAEAGLAGKTIEGALLVLAAKVGQQGSDIANVLASETVFENGFDPLEGGFRATGVAFEVFDQWIEVLPTDQVVALEYTPSV